jgi:hypothetical protein
MALLWGDAVRRRSSKGGTRRDGDLVKKIDAHLAPLYLSGAQTLFVGPQRPTVLFTLAARLQAGAPRGRPVEISPAMSNSGLLWEDWRPGNFGGFARVVGAL